MITLGQSNPYPYQVIAGFCEDADLNYQKIRLQTLFEGAFKNPKNKNCALDYTYYYKIFTHLLNHLNRLMDERLFPHRIVTYGEYAIPKMVRNFRKFIPSEDEPSNFSQTPNSLTISEIHQPYCTLFKILKRKSFKKWKKTLYHWQVNALTSEPNKTMNFQNDFLESFKDLIKIVEICYLIYTVELDSKSEINPYYSTPLLHRKKNYQVYTKSLLKDYSISLPKLEKHHYSNNQITIPQSHEKNLMDIPNQHNPNSLLKSIYKAFQKRSYNQYLKGLNVLYFSAFYKTHSEIEKNPIHTFKIRENLLELFQKLDRFLPSIIGYNPPNVYGPKLFKKIIRHRKETANFQQENQSLRLASWECLPKFISDKELRKPYVTLRACMMNLKSLNYKFCLEDLQNSAFSGNCKRNTNDMEDCYKLYLVLQKTIEVCFLIYAAELNFGKTENLFKKSLAKP